jgi:protein TonB
MSASFDEPSIPPQLRRPLAALWISLGLHAAVIALVHVAPPAGVSVEAPVIEVHLVSVPPAPVARETPPSAPAVPQPEPAPETRLAASAAPDAPPPAKPAAPPPASPVAEPRHDVPPPATGTASSATEAVPASPAAAPAATLTSSVDLTYYSARDLDVQPHALRVIRPEYPLAADRQKVSGTLRLQLKLEADGRVSDIEVVSATPPGVFEDSAIKAFRDARFAPAQKNGRPVRALVVIEVVYDWAGQPR